MLQLMLSSSHWPYPDYSSGTSSLSIRGYDTSLTHGTDCLLPAAKAQVTAAFSLFGLILPVDARISTEFFPVGYLSQKVQSFT